MYVRISLRLKSFDFRKNLNNHRKKAEKRSMEGLRVEYTVLWLGKETSHDF